MKTKRNLFAALGWLIWKIAALVLRIAARLGSRWARNKLDEHQAESSAHPITRRRDRNRNQ